MQPLLLVLLTVTSALAAPALQGVNVQAVDFNSVGPARDPGLLVSSFITDGAFDLIDGGDTAIYVVTIKNILADLANQKDPNSQALALAQAIAVLGGLATGIPGNACAASQLIDAYVNSQGNPNSNSFRQALGNFISSLSASIDLIVQLSTNADSLRYAGGSRGTCNGGGRVYAFEPAWDSILGNASQTQVGLLNEQYCIAKRLYCALNVRSNNVGALVTAASLPPVTQVFRGALREVANFLRAAPSNAAGAAGAAKQALERGLYSY